MSRLTNSILVSTPVIFLKKAREKYAKDEDDMVKEEIGPIWKEIDIVLNYKWSIVGLTCFALESSIK